MLLFTLRRAPSSPWWKPSSPSQPAPPLPRAPALGNSHCWGTGFRKRPLWPEPTSLGPLAAPDEQHLPWTSPKGKPCEKTPLGYPSPGLHPEGQRAEPEVTHLPTSQASLGMGPDGPPMRPRSWQCSIKDTPHSGPGDTTLCSQPGLCASDLWLALSSQAEGTNIPHHPTVREVEPYLGHSNKA